MVTVCLEELINSNPGTIYVHNLGKFDAFFMLKYIYQNYVAKPFYKSKVLLQLHVTKKSLKGPNKIMVFKDSLQLLQGSLKSLGETFKTETQKGYFPYKFVSDKTFNYIGHIPDYKFYENQLPLIEYLSKKKSPEGSN